MSTVVRTSRTLKTRTLKISLATLIFAVLSACAVEGGGYGGYGGDVGVGVGYVGDYYEPCCVGYGGWGRGYRVGPPGGRGHDDHRGPGRSAPSIPSHPRAGGGHAGGGGRGGSGHH